MKSIFPLIAVFKRELLLSYRHPMTLVNPLIFFILITLLFPFAITSDPKKLVLIGPGVIWIAALLATMLASEDLFGTDYAEGTLEQMALNQMPLSWLVFAKVFINWALLIIPLLITTLVISQFFYMPLQGVKILILSLLLGSPLLTFIGAIGCALTLGLANRGILLVLLILPLYLPILIFGAGAANDAMLGLPTVSQLAFLGALLALTLTFAPVAIAAAIKVSLE